MTRLHPHLVFDAVETLWSFVCRLAAFHVGGSISRFLGDLGIDPGVLRVGRAQAVLRLAEATGVHAQDLQQATFQTSGGRSHTFRGEAFSHAFLPGNVTRLCPLCLADDETQHLDLPPAAAWRQRIAWRFRPVACCARHEVELVPLAWGQEGRDTVGLQRLVDAEGGVSTLQARARPHAPGLLQLWVEERLEGRQDTGGSWLAGQTIEQGARACEMLGAQLLFGGRRNVRVMRSLSVRDWEETGACGLEIARGGSPAIRSALDDLRERTHVVAVQAGGDGVYGLLYSWLDERSPAVDPSPIRGLVREHLLEHTAFAPGERVLGEPVIERQMHSIRSLADSLGMPRSEVVRRLVRLGWMAPDLDPVVVGRLAFPAEVAERNCAAIAAAVLPPIAARLLGCTGEELASLADAGVLEPLVDHGSNGASRTTKYASEEVIGLLTRLRSQAARINDTRGMVGLAEAAARLELGFGELVARILAGEAGHLYWSGLRTGLCAVRLREADLAETAPPAGRPSARTPAAGDADLPAR